MGHFERKKHTGHTDTDVNTHTHTSLKKETPYTNFFHITKPYHQNPNRLKQTFFSNFGEVQRLCKGKFQSSRTQGQGLGCFCHILTNGNPPTICLGKCTPCKINTEPNVQL